MAGVAMEGRRFRILSSSIDVGFIDACAAYLTLVQDRLPLDKYLDDLQQGLIPGGSEPKVMEYDPVTQEMPVRPSLCDTMRQDMETKVANWDDTPMSPERSPAPTIGFSYDYMTDEPPAIQRIAEAPTHSSPYQDPPKLRARAVPALLAPRPRSTSVPPTPTTVARMAKRYMPVTEEVTLPISPARVETVPATPSPVYRPGRGRGMASGAHNPVRRQVSEQEVRLDKQKQRPRRHRLRAPRGRKNQTSLHKSRIWHVIYDYRIHQRID